MSAFLYGIGLQWKMDLRSRDYLVVFYVVPLLFYALMGGVFASVLPFGKNDLIAMMSVFSVSMGALIGLPPTVADLCRTDVRKAYAANGVPLWQGIVQAALAAAVHLVTLCLIIVLTAPLMFDADLPRSGASYAAGCLLLIGSSLCIAVLIGLIAPKQPAAASMIFFLPSILLSGIMVPEDVLPEAASAIGFVFPATWAYRLMTSPSIHIEDVWPQVLIAAAAVFVSALLLRRLRVR